MFLNWVADRYTRDITIRTCELEIQQVDVRSLMSQIALLWAMDDLRLNDLDLHRVDVLMLLLILVACSTYNCCCSLLTERSSHCRCTYKFVLEPAESAYML